MSAHSVWCKTQREDLFRNRRSDRFVGIYDTAILLLSSDVFHGY